MNNLIDRINCMEAKLNEARAAADALRDAIDRYENALSAVNELERWYLSPQWLKDRDADASGQIPASVPRGVLTEDAIWDLMTDAQALRGRMAELSVHTLTQERAVELMQHGTMPDQAVPESAYAPCDRPGRMTELHYTSKMPDGAPIAKRALVYLPHGYDEGDRNYPVLYLMHGGGGNEDEVFGGIEAKSPLKNVLDNAIAAGHIQPMIVVAPTYLIPGDPAVHRAPGAAVNLTHRFPTELKEDLIPAVDAAFRTEADRDHRAFSGFSMGSETTWSVLADAGSEVAIVLPLSGDYWALGLRGGESKPEETVDALLSRMAANGVKPQHVRILAATGDKDIAYPALQPMMTALARRDGFLTGSDPATGNLVYLLKQDGWHTYDACWMYLWQLLPGVFPVWEEDGGMPLSGAANEQNCPDT